MAHIWNNRTEVIDLSGQGRSCEISDLPSQRYYSAMTSFGNLVVVCGGLQWPTIRKVLTLIKSN